MSPLGAWGVFAIAGADGAGVPLPGAVDAVVASYVYTHNPLHAWVYVLMAAAGSTAGCIVVYIIGYLGGEVALQRRMSREKFEKTRQSFERNKFLALALPAVLPPPFPFKVFVLAAAVFEVKLPHFLVAIFSGRIVRYSVLAVLTIEFGPGIVSVATLLVRRHLLLTVVVLGGIIAAVLIVRRLRRAAVKPLEEHTSKLP